MNLEPFKNHFVWEDTNPNVDVFEFIDGRVNSRGDIDDCPGEDIVASFDAWSRCGYAVQKGEKSQLRTDHGVPMFHWSQVGEESELDEWEMLNGDWGDRM